MRSVLIIMVNYGSYKEMNDYLISIEKAVAVVDKDIKVTVAIVDNTENNMLPVDYQSSILEVLVFPYNVNLGYMGGATRALEDMGKETVCKYDYVIISNVDIQLAEDFFVELLNVNSTGCGWIAPAVCRRSDGTNENPFMPVRPSRSKLKLICYIYAWPLAYRLMHLRSVIKRRFFNATQTTNDIYAGIGSIIITTKELIDKHYPYRFPAFMYGEEIYFAEIVRMSKLKTIYAPSVRVDDITGVSTNKLGLKRKCSMMRSGVSKMYESYFN